MSQKNLQKILFRGYGKRWTAPDVSDETTLAGAVQKCDEKELFSVTDGRDVLYFCIVLRTRPSRLRTMFKPGFNSSTC